MKTDTKYEIIIALVWIAQFGFVLGICGFMIIRGNTVNDVLLAMGIGTAIIIIGNFLYTKLPDKKQKVGSVE